MKILIVDDNEDARMISKTILESDGHTIMVAANGKEALDIASASRPDIFISDILMPEMDGYQLCMKVKKDDRLKNAPFIFYTATYTEDKDKELGMSIGAYRFIRKPVEPDEFIEIIRAAAINIEKGKIAPNKPFLEKDKEVLKLYNERLTFMGYDIIGSASSGQEAVEMARHLRPDIVLMDIVMPGSIDGIDAAEKIKVELDIPVIFITAYASQKFVDKAKDVEPFGYIVKPFQEREIKATIEVAIYKKDIERKLRKSEEELRNTRDYLDNLFNYANAPIIVWDIHGRITRFNRAFEHMTGLFADKVIGQELSILFPESSRDESLGKIQRTLSGEYWKSVEIPILRKDGDVRTALWNSANVFDKDGITVIATIAQGQDITERKQAEEALRKSEKKYRHLFENAPSGIYEIDYEQFRFVNVNEFICKSTGYSEKELLSMNPMDLLTEDSKTLYIERLEKLSTEEKPDRNVEYDIITKNGQKLNVILNIDFISKNGKLTGARIVTHDITELKKLEEELRQARKMESIGTLTGGIAHDFNNILGIIVGNTELALEDVPKWNPAYSSLEEIKTASLRAANIVRQLLSFSRKTDQKLQPMEIAAVIKEALKFLRSTIPKTIDIEQDISVTNETILADPTQINQIIMNLCINASHAMEQTGGNLTIIVENVLLDDHSAKDYPDLKSGKYVKVMVSDTGSGIDPKIIDRIFDPYFTTKGIGKGSGMGLSVVHGIVKNHGGAITVDSSPGKGTKFSMFFPLATEKPMVETQTTQEIPRGSETILFVDDEISIVNMVQRMLERLGYKVETATTPQDALERFALNPDNFDLVITDMTMPRMTGVKLSEKLMAIRPDIPIIICTGYSALVDEEKAKELGLAAYVMKPINLLETAKTIRKVLDKK